jgi:hypothetical protein
MIVESRWNVDWQGKPKFSEKTCPSATFVQSHPTKKNYVYVTRFLFLVNFYNLMYTCKIVKLKTISEYYKNVMPESLEIKNINTTIISLTLLTSSVPGERT